MKLHLPKGLRTALLVCISGLGAVAPTVCTGVLIGGAMVSTTWAETLNLTSGSTSVGTATDDYSDITVNSGANLDFKGSDTTADKSNPVTFDGDVSIAGTGGGNKSGALTVDSGGSANAKITGTLTVTATARIQLWGDRELSVNELSLTAGTLTINQDGDWAKGTLKVSNDITGNGSLTLNSGALEVGGTITVAEGSTLTANSGTTLTLNKTIVNNGAVNLNGSIVVSDTLASQLTVETVAMYSAGDSNGFLATKLYSGLITGGGTVAGNAIVKDGNTVKVAAYDYSTFYVSAKSTVSNPNLSGATNATVIKVAATGTIEFSGKGYDIPSIALDGEGSTLSLSGASPNSLTSVTLGGDADANHIIKGTNASVRTNVTGTGNLTLTNSGNNVFYLKGNVNNTGTVTIEKTIQLMTEGGSTIGQFGSNVTEVILKDSTAHLEFHNGLTTNSIKLTQNGGTLTIGGGLSTYSDNTDSTATLELKAGSTLFGAINNNNTLTLGGTMTNAGNLTISSAEKLALASGATLDSLGSAVSGVYSEGANGFRGTATFLIKAGSAEGTKSLSVGGSTSSFVLGDTTYTISGGNAYSGFTQSSTDKTYYVNQSTDYDASKMGSITEIRVAGSSSTAETTLTFTKDTTLGNSSEPNEKIVLAGNANIAGSNISFQGAEITATGKNNSISANLKQAWNVNLTVEADSELDFSGSLVTTADGPHFHKTGAGKLTVTNTTFGNNFNVHLDAGTLDLSAVTTLNSASLVTNAGTSIILGTTTLSGSNDLKGNVNITGALTLATGSTLELSSASITISSTLADSLVETQGWTYTADGKNGFAQEAKLYSGLTSGSGTLKANGAEVKSGSTTLGKLWNDGVIAKATGDVDYSVYYVKNSTDNTLRISKTDMDAAGRIVVEDGQWLTIHNTDTAQDLNKDITLGEGSTLNLDGQGVADGTKVTLDGDAIIRSYNIGGDISSGTYTMAGDVDGTGDLTLLLNAQNFKITGEINNTGTVTIDSSANHAIVIGTGGSFGNKVTSVIVGEGDALTIANGTTNSINLNLSSTGKLTVQNSSTLNLGATSSISGGSLILSGGSVLGGSITLVSDSDGDGKTDKDSDGKTIYSENAIKGDASSAGKLHANVAGTGNLTLDNKLELGRWDDSKGSIATTLSNTGNVTINSGADVNLTNKSVIGNTGDVTVKGTVTVNGDGNDSAIKNTGNVTIDGGTLNLTGGVLNNGGNVYISSGTLNLSQFSTNSHKPTLSSKGDVNITGTGSLVVNKEATVSSTVKASDAATISGSATSGATYENVTVKADKISGGTLSGATVTIDKSFALEGVTLDDCDFTINAALNVGEDTEVTGTDFHVSAEGKLTGSLLSLSSGSHELEVKSGLVFGDNSFDIGETSYTYVSTDQLGNITLSEGASFTVELSDEISAILTAAAKPGEHYALVLSGLTLNVPMGTSGDEALMGDEYASFLALKNPVSSDYTVSVGTYNGNAALLFTSTKAPLPTPAVPEPTTATLSLLALAALAARRRRK